MTVAERKRREKEKRKMEILDAAEALFVIKGYDFVSMEEIAQMTDLAKGTIFLYFRSKEDLFTSVVLRSVRTFNSKIMENIANNEDSNISKIKGIGEAVIWFSTCYPDHLSLLRYFRSGRFDNCSNPSDDAKEILRLSSDNDRMVMDVIQEGIRSGEVRSDLEPLVTLLFLRFVTNCVLAFEPDQWRQLEEKGITKESLVDGLWTLMRSAIQGGSK